MENNKKIELPKPPVFEGMSQYRPPLCFELVGKKFELVMDDGYDYELNFTDRKTLSFGKAGEQAKTYKYDCVKPEETTYFVNLEMVVTDIITVFTFVLDLEQSLVTWANANIGSNPRLPHLSSMKITFGAIKREDGTVPTIRHGYTRDMIGKAIQWNYGTFSVVHVYSSERYYRITTSPEETARRMERDPKATEERRRKDKIRLYEEPANYIKIKDGVYIFNLNEALACRERGHGSDLLFLMNLNRMYDVGRSFGFTAEGKPENYTYGAFGEYYDASELLARESTEYIR